MAAKSQFMLTLKIIIVFLVFAQQNACSEEKPCLNYGTYRSALNSSYCHCQAGFNGSRCENKITKQVVCGAFSQEKTFENGNWRLKEQALSIRSCGNNEKCAYVSISFVVESKNKTLTDYYNRTFTMGGCTNATWCQDRCKFLRLAEQNSQLFYKACNITCCDGDFCNINATGLPKGEKPPTVPPEDKTWMWIVIGVCCGVVLLLVIIVVVYCKKKKHA